MSIIDVSCNPSRAARVTTATCTNNLSICVSALKHSPSKRKSITRPLRPLDGDFDSTGESVRWFIHTRWTIYILLSFFFFLFFSDICYYRSVSYASRGPTMTTGSTISGPVRWSTFFLLLVCIFSFETARVLRKARASSSARELSRKLQR